MLIAKSRIPANVLDEALYIEIDEKQDVGIEFPTYISDISTFMAIGEQIEQLDKELDDTGRSLKAAVCFLYPMLKKINHLDVYQSLLEYVDRIIELDEEVMDPEGIPEFFIDELTKAVRNYHCYSLKEITDLPVNWKMGCFYSQKYLFLSQDLFEKFAESLHLRVKTNQLKRILTDAGVLSPGNGKFTAKMNIQTENGLKRQNMLRFPLEKLNQVGRPEFIYFLNGGK